MILLSVIVPAFNEEARLSGVLTDYGRYLDGHLPNAYELLVIDDGSCDRTASIVRYLMGQFPRLRLIQHDVNRGKGAAIRTGVLESKGQFVLMADADGATPIGFESHLRESLCPGTDVAIGSRYRDAQSVTRRRRWHRHVASRVFHLTVQLLLGIAVTDTQCGFKMFSRSAAQILFRDLRECGYLFDLELLLLANHFDIGVVEVPVSYRDTPGSKVSLPRIAVDAGSAMVRLVQQRFRLRANSVRLRHTLKRGCEC